jgi:hypothetical protein
MGPGAVHKLFILYSNVANKHSITSLNRPINLLNTNWGWCIVPKINVLVGMVIRLPLLSALGSPQPSESHLGRVGFSLSLSLSLDGWTLTLAISMTTIAAERGTTLSNLSLGNK